MSNNNDFCQCFCMAIIWMVLLFFVVWPVALALAGLWILLMVSSTSTSDRFYSFFQSSGERVCVCVCVCLCVFVHVRRNTSNSRIATRCITVH